MKSIFILVMIYITSCTPQKKMATGTYTIKSVNGSIVTFKEVRGKYDMQTDTLKVNQQIKMNVIRLRH